MQFLDSKINFGGLRIISVHAIADWQYPNARLEMLIKWSDIEWLDQTYQLVYTYVIVCVYSDYFNLVRDPYTLTRT